jgi:hypothetical protein
MTRVQATEDILIAKPGQVGAYELLYKAGDYIREEDLEALGLSQERAKIQPQAEDKAARGPREAPKQVRASRDKALSEPKESPDG